jgi:hypothetical protein
MIGIGAMRHENPQLKYRLFDPIVVRDCGAHRQRFPTGVSSSRRLAGRPLRPLCEVHRQTLPECGPTGHENSAASFDVNRATLSSSGARTAAVAVVERLDSFADRTSEGGGVTRLRDSAGIRSFRPGSDTVDSSFLNKSVMYSSFLWELNSSRLRESATVQVVLSNRQTAHGNESLLVGGLRW